MNDDLLALTLPSFSTEERLERAASLFRWAAITAQLGLDTSRTDDTREKYRLLSAQQLSWAIRYRDYI